MMDHYTVERMTGLLDGAFVLEGSFKGDLSGIASLEKAVAGDLSFLGNPKYRSLAAESKASVILVPEDYDGSPKPGQLFVRVKHPSYALALICRDIELSLEGKKRSGIHPTAVVEPSAVVSTEASVGPFCHIGPHAVVGAAVLESHVAVGSHAKIGNEAHLFSRVSVGNYCEVGERCRLSAGCVIGSDGYGYEFLDGAHQRVPQIGNVVLENDVDVGANTTIDRARFGSTRIGAGTKIDNQVQIAHNVKMGNHCLIVAQVGISGSTELGHGVIVGGQAGIAGHLKVGDGAMIAGGTAVVSDVEPGHKVRGYPAMPMMLFNRVAVLQRKLPDFFKRFEQLEKTVKVDVLDDKVSTQ